MTDQEETYGAEKYWFNTKTGKVEHGPQSNWENRMGPYDTAEEAEQALAKAAENTKQWDAEDKEWNG
ncbi:hypothetical protein [Brevibacterium gallinarum]|uniref:SPOR domain-containing protein n=1 Tax=Brevibacterium gallinarum TaxID=2762220 RepID=A0ABR8WUX1_9MICO|nr:hypothetical protein [Brevibacterium gallinarum]MBD8020875.1 hypothetical protein [Brevibacterium gallinarum]